jgi:hypothetical protein
MAERAERKEGRKRGGDMADPPQKTVREDKGSYRWCVKVEVGFAVVGTERTVDVGDGQDKGNRTGRLRGWLSG